MNRQLAACLVAAAFLAPTSSAQIFTFDLVPLSGASVEPNPTTSTAAGLATVELDTSVDALGVFVEFSGLQGTETAAHVHGPVDATGLGPVMFDLNPVVGSPKTVHVSVTAQQIADLQAGACYVDIHTSAFPAGEIRGDIVATYQTWVNVGHDKPGTGGETPRLVGVGALTAGAAVKLDLSDAKPLAQGLLFVGLSKIDAPFKDGVLVPDPQFAVVLATDAMGHWQLGFHWPVGVTVGTNLYWHAWIKDAAATLDASASNALRSMAE